MELSSQIEVVLVETSHPGNIGATARAMKTMGLSQLVLVNPKFFPDERANARATSRAEDILRNARVVPTLSEAINHSSCVIGTSALSRHLPWPMLGMREIGPKVCSVAKNAQKVSLVFGRERGGLYNDELQLCHFHVEIPSSPECRALNLAAAVQVITYEIMMTMREGKTIEPAREMAMMSQFDGLMEHLYATLIDLKFLDPENPKLLKEKLRRLFLRAEPDFNDINILRGILSAVNMIKKEPALTEFVENHGRRDVRELRGQIKLDPSYDYKKLRVFPDLKTYSKNQHETKGVKELKTLLPKSEKKLTVEQMNEVITKRGK